MLFRRKKKHVVRHPNRPLYLFPFVKIERSKFVPKLSPNPNCFVSFRPPSCIVCRRPSGQTPRLYGAQKSFLQERAWSGARGPTETTLHHCGVFSGNYDECSRSRKSKGKNESITVRDRYLIRLICALHCHLLLTRLKRCDMWHCDARNVWILPMRMLPFYVSIWCWVWPNVGTCFFSFL